MTFPLNSLLSRPPSLLSMAAVVLNAAPIFAHDMWIVPTTFFPQAGEIIGVRLRVGQDLLGDPLPRDSTLINQFVVEDAAGRRPVVGRDGTDPAGYVLAGKPGLLIVGYRSNPSAIELPAEKFNQYVKDEGLDGIAALRGSRHETGAPAHELFARCAKSLLLSGPAGENQGDRQLGFTLELVAERNPYTIRVDGYFPVRLTYENRPLAGALVVAMNRLNPSERQSVRTDNDGRALFRLRSDGMWLIKAVHMIPAPKGSNAEWASFWASLTFELKRTSAERN